MSAAAIASPVAGAKLLEDDFDRIASDLDACLARSEWYPRNWQRGG
ncbi:MAG: hypothetical protein R3D25_05930 [Geminicoccaceae bacterium]